MAEKKKTQTKVIPKPNNKMLSVAVIGTKTAKHLQEGKTYFVTEEQAKALVEKKEAKLS